MAGTLGQNPIAELTGLAIAGDVVAGYYEGELKEALGAAAINLGVMYLGGKAVQLTGQQVFKLGRQLFERVYNASPMLVQRLMGRHVSDRTLAMARYNRLPYDPRALEKMLAERYGREKVTSSTLPRAMEKNVALTGTRHPVTSVVYDQRGLPIFDHVAVFETRIARDVAVTKVKRAHMSAATRHLKEAIQRDPALASKFTPEQIVKIKAGSPQIPDLTWHHHQDLGRLQLIPRDIHRKTGHVGGSELWKR